MQNKRRLAAVRSKRARVQRLIQRLLKTIDPQVPAHTNYADEYTIDDGGGYGDPFEDTRPDFMKD